MMRRMVDQGVDHLWLDLRGIDRFADRFPTIAADLAAAGVDPVGDLVPVAPAAHYLCGGVVTDLDGATALPGLWAAGEVACSGVHGANRLASNSLLEGMVFAHRALTAIIGGRDGPARTGAMRAVLGVAGDPDDFRVIGGRPLAGWGAPTPIDRRRPVSPAADPGALLIGIQRAMTLGAGVLRDAASLAAAGAALDAVASSAGAPSGPAALEVANLLEVGRAVVAAATARTESRGAHTRRDWPDPSPGLRCRLVLSG
jgi:L-aspartate oxidase